MNTPKKGIAYAAHKLRIGNYYIPYPLISQQDTQLWQLDLFTRETERTIFISGTISLRSPKYPETSSIPTHISLEECRKLISTTQDWELIYRPIYIDSEG